MAEPGREPRGTRWLVAGPPPSPSSYTSGVAAVAVTGTTDPLPEDDGRLAPAESARPPAPEAGKASRLPAALPRGELKALLPPPGEAERPLAWRRDPVPLPPLPPAAPPPASMEKESRLASLMGLSTPLPLSFGK